jgi:hypothetical protein
MPALAHRVILLRCGIGRNRGIADIDQARTDQARFMSRRPG